MGRTKNVKNYTRPAARFAADLREARIEADAPTYREMAAATGSAHSSLSEADRGERLPTWECTVCYLSIDRAWWRLRNGKPGQHYWELRAALAPHVREAVMSLRDRG